MTQSLKRCEHCRTQIVGGEPEWAEHLAYEHPEAWEQWYRRAYRDYHVERRSKG